MIKRNIAVVGLGHWGQNLVRNFDELGVLGMVCDTDYATLSKMQSRYNVDAMLDFGQMLDKDDIEGVVIATPAITHYGLAKKALLKGKDVFVEKPMAMEVAQGRDLVHLADNMGRVLLVGHVLEYHPAVVKIKSMVDEGFLGDIRYIYSHRMNLGRFRTEENVLWSFAPHDISVILLLVGKMPVEVTARAGYYISPGVADVTVTTLAFDGGVRAHVFVSWLHPYKEHKMGVIGSKQMVMFDDESVLKVEAYDYELVQGEHGLVSTLKGVEWGGVSTEEPLSLECQDFLHCMELRSKPRVDGRKGVQVLEVLEACQKSLDKGKE